MSLEDPDLYFLSWFCGDFLSVGKIFDCDFCETGRIYSWPSELVAEHWP